MAKVNNDLYQYEECGLPNVFLTSGFNISESEYGEGVSFNDFDDLHKAITLELTGKPAPLTGKEVRFLRVELDWSQKELGAKLGVSDQAVSLWERDQNSIGVSESLVLRLLAVEKCTEQLGSISLLMDRIESVDFDKEKWAIVLSWKPAKEDHWVPGSERVA